MAVLNYAQQYQQALQQKYSAGLFFNALYNAPANARLRWVNANTVQIPRIDVTGFVDTNRDAIAAATRKVDNSWETLTLAHDREFKTLVDPMDIDETNMAVSINNITSVFNDEQKIPEMDKYMSSKLYAEWTGHGETADTTAITVSNAMTLFDQYMEALDEAEVPQEGRILYVRTPIHTLLKQSDDLQRQFNVQSNDGRVNRSIRSLDDVTVIPVPTERMHTLYDFTTGAVRDAAGFKINMLLIHPTALVSPQKYEFVDLDSPSANTGGKFLYYERKYWDVFVFERKAIGIQVNREAVAGL